MLKRFSTLLLALLLVLSLVACGGQTESSSTPSSSKPSSSEDSSSKPDAVQDYDDEYNNNELTPEEREELEELWGEIASGANATIGGEKGE